MFLQLCILSYQGYGSTVSYHSASGWKEVCKKFVNFGERKAVQLCSYNDSEESVTLTTLPQEMLSIWTRDRDYIYRDLSLNSFGLSDDY